MLRGLPKPGTWWCLSGDYPSCYIHAGVRRSMHRVLMRAGDTDYVDHIDKNPLNNQKSNLRICTNQQNIFGKAKSFGKSSQYKGVSVRKHKIKPTVYRSYIVVNRTQQHLGSYYSELVAAERYDVEALRLFGEFASLNFPEKLEMYQLWLQQGLPATHTIRMKYGRPQNK